MVLNNFISVVERLKEAGWSEELSKTDSHERPEKLDFVLKACQKELTDQGKRRLPDLVT